MDMQCVNDDAGIEGRQGRSPPHTLVLYAASELAHAR
jgi:hypothetical protein